MPKYLMPDEEEQIRKEYRDHTGTQRDIAARHNVSKSTVNNVISGYKYGGITGHRAGKSGSPSFAKRVHDGLQVNLSQFEGVVAKERTSAIETGDTILLTALEHAAHIAASCMTEPIETAYESLKRERMQAEHDGWKALSDMDMTEYVISVKVWQLLTVVLGDCLKTPWSDAVDCRMAKNRAASIRFTGLGKVKKSVCHGTHIDENVDSVRFIDAWTNIRELINKRSIAKCNDKRRRVGADRRVMEGIIEAMECGISLRELSRRGYGTRKTLERYYKLWYQTGVFRDMRDLASARSALSDVLDVLDEMERFRLVCGIDIVPELKQLFKSATQKKP